MKKVSIDEALRLLGELKATPALETVPITAAEGRVLAEDITAVLSVPPFDRSPYDGYAFMGEDTAKASKNDPVVLKVVEELPAGKAPTVKIVPGTASKILTGAPVPEGANAIIKYEETEFTEDTVKIFSPVAPNSDIVYAGEDVSKGSLMAEKGKVITPGTVGVLAGQGIASVPVYKRPAVFVLSTGSELLEPGQPYENAKIYNSNVYTISAYLKKMGLEPVPGGSIPDDPDLIASKIAEAAEKYDVVVTTGGASVGDYDYAVRASEKAGARVLFWKISMKPGGAVVASEKNGKLILSLSGNPGAAITTLLRVAAPYLKRLCGVADYAPEPVEVILKEDFKKPTTQTRYLRGRLSIEGGKAMFISLDGQGNGVVSSYVGCDMLGEIPENSPPVKAGTSIKAYRV